MTLSNLSTDRTAINAIKTILQANLTDPRQQYTADDRNWIHTDKPLVSATYPRIQIRKRGPSASAIMSIGQDFIEWRSMILDIQFWTKAPFRWKNTDNAYLTDEELCKKWNHDIWTTLKAQQSDLKTTYGITGLKMMDDEDPFLEPDTQMYSSIVSIRIWFFRT